MLQEARAGQGEIEGGVAFAYGPGRGVPDLLADVEILEEVAGTGLAHRYTPDAAARRQSYGPAHYGRNVTDPHGSRRPAWRSRCSQAAAGPDLRERELCARALTVLDPEAGALEPVDGAAPGPVTLRYAARGRSETLTCRFAPDATGAPELAGIAGTAVGELSAIDLFFLSTYGLPRAEAPAAELGPLTYLAQQLVNATGLAAVYALLALGYSLLYGLIGRVNLAFGEFCAFGTLAALAGATLLGGAAPGRAAVAAVLAVLPLGLALGLATHGVVLRPLMRRTSLAFLVATLGLSIGLSEAMRLAQGSRGAWYPPGFVRPLTLWHAGGAAVTISTAQLLAAGLAIGASGGVAFLMRRTNFGRAWRACSDDPGAAALVGVHMTRTVRRSSILAATCATLAGAALAVQYGAVGFDAGLLLGFKALTAAIVGGIGSPAGAGSAAS